MTALREKHSTAPRRQRSAMIAVTRRVFAAAPLRSADAPQMIPDESAPAQNADATARPAGAPARSAQNNDTLRADQRHAPRHTVNETMHLRERNARKEPEPGTAPQVQENEKKHRRRRQGTTTPRGRKDPNRRDDAPAAEPHLLPAFSASGSPVRLAPDLRRWRAVPRRAGAVVVGGARRIRWAASRASNQRSPRLSRCR